MNIEFDDIAPYRDSDIPAVMARIAQSKYFSPVVKLIFPNHDVDDFKSSFLKIQTIYDFQTQIMLPFSKWVVENTIHNISSSGLQQLEKNKGYLFTSNHRDIVLDACMLQLLLYEADFETCEISFGSNLMINQLIVDIGKSNKMFKIQRATKGRELVRNSYVLSSYIRSKIQNKSSIWIAQRNGRTKDGFDQTDQGLIKMFSMSGDRDALIDNFVELHITPVATSYRYEPCDFMKLREIYIRKRFGTYQKAPWEDLHSIVSGIKEEKGAMHIAICEPITFQDLQQYQYSSNQEIIDAVKKIIDNRIYKNYKLFDTNYIAYDLIHQNKSMSAHYSEDDKRLFVDRIERMIAKIRDEFGSQSESEARQIVLGIYGYPVMNYLHATL